MDSRDKSRRLFLFLEWDIDKDEKFEIQVQMDSGDKSR